MEENRMEDLMAIERLKKYFPVMGGVLKKKVAEVKAVDEVTFDIHKGETFGIVGESGCGKTTLAKTILRLISPNGGHIFYKMPKEVAEAIKALERDNPKSKSLKHLLKEYDQAYVSGPRLRKLRRNMQIVYQDPTTSLDPRMLVKDIVSEPLVAQGLEKRSTRMERVLETLQMVGLGEKHLYRYPHEFSGGQRQRIAVARAIITSPEFIVLDEPTSSVDVSVRAQLLNMFQDLQKNLGLTYMFISHDLSVVECISDRVGVMYLGKIVEQAGTDELYKNPLHPYSQALFNSIPVPDPTRRRERAPLSGEPPSPVNPPSGCRFHPRCSLATSNCERQEPPLIDVGNEHYVACFAVSR
jgi:oligopeptide/dipeptide ABC transporter ATP-binding protein